MISRKNWPAVVLILIITVFVSQSYGWINPGSESLNSAQPGYYSIDHFIDGDTIAVSVNGRAEEVRFIGVDTPETHDPRKPVQCYGPTAAAYTKAEIGNHKVKLVADPLDTNRDRYGRLLRYVYLPDGTLLNLKLIRTGHGFYYPYFPFSKKAEFSKAEQQAQSNDLGLWAECRPTPTDAGGYTSNPL